jgi:hypothetical protein
MFLGSRARAGAEGLQIYPYLWVDFLNNVGSLTPHNPRGLQGLLRDQLYFMETECASCEVRTGL